MSASLVGSEMCIRDRSQGLRGLRVVGLLIGSVRCRDACDFEPPQASPSSCLLYTSDAADDM
eukprot:6725411-Alexandrium_andersonii.AAC.1